VTFDTSAPIAGAVSYALPARCNITSEVMLSGVDLLLVEDSRADAHMAMRVLFKRKLAERIEWIQDGRDALDYLFREGRHADRVPGNPRLVVLDINIPGMNGIQVLNWMRANPLTKHVPVVMFSSSDVAADLRLGYEGGANSYLLKPVDHREYAELLAKAGEYWLKNNLPPEP
jgi:CheY-like chemotaxis protein